MSKSSVWSSLKALGYDSKQLKADTGKTYQSVTEQQLQTILDVTEKHFKTDVPNWRNNTTNELQQPIIDEVVVTDDTVPNEVIIDEQVILPEADSSVSEVITEQPNPEVTLDSSSDTTATVQDVLPLTTKFNWSQDTYPSDDDCAVYMEMGTEYRRVEKVSNKLIKDVVSRCKHKVSDLYNPTFYGDPLPTYEVVEQTPLVMPVEVTTDDPWLTEQPTKPDTAVQSSVTASTSNDVNVPEQVKQVSETSTEATETINSEINMNTPINSYSFAFQEQKLPITVLEVSTNDGKKIEVVNLTDAYFIELRDDKLYVSYGLHIKTFKASNYRIVKAFNSLLNGSNFIHLRDLREANRDILVNLNRVKTIERTSKFIKFHWNGWLTYPGYHDLNDWQVID